MDLLQKQQESVAERRFLPDRTFDDFDELVGVTYRLCALSLSLDAATSFVGATAGPRASKEHANQNQLAWPQMLRDVCAKYWQGYHGYIEISAASSGWRCR